MQVGQDGRGPHRKVFGRLPPPTPTLVPACLVCVKHQRQRWSRRRQRWHRSCSLVRQGWASCAGSVRLSAVESPPQGTLDTLQRLVVETGSLLETALLSFQGRDARSRVTGSPVTRQTSSVVLAGQAGRGTVREPSGVLVLGQANHHELSVNAYCILHMWTESDAAAKVSWLTLLS